MSLFFTIKASDITSDAHLHPDTLCEWVVNVDRIECVLKNSETVMIRFSGKNLYAIRKDWEEIWKLLDAAGHSERKFKGN